MDQQKFTQLVHECLNKASSMYDLPELNPANVTITYKPNGLCIGSASRRSKRCFLTFSLEAIQKYPDEMVNDTIPHEVAHLVCFIKPHYGSNHDAGWKRVCRNLGGDDSRTHHLDVTPAKQKVITRYVYVVQGHTRVLGHKYHKLIQRLGSVPFTFQDLGVKATIHRTHFSHTELYQRVGTKIVKVERPIEQKAAHTIAPAANPAVTSGKSKRELCVDIYNANSQLTRGEVIDMFVANAGMTKAGAGTYYQNIKSGKWA